MNNIEEIYNELLDYGFSCAVSTYEKDHQVVEVLKCGHYYIVENNKDEQFYRIYERQLDCNVKEVARIGSEGHAVDYLKRKMR